MKEEEEVENSTEITEKKLEKDNKNEEKAEIKGNAKDWSKHPLMTTSYFETLGESRKNMERLAQSAVTMQKQVEDFQRKMNAIDFSSPVKKVQEFQLMIGDSTKKVVQMNQNIRDLLQDVNWYPLVEASRMIGKIADQDEKIKEYNSSPHFWNNLKKVSVELISLPLKPTDDLLEELAKENMSLDVVRKLIKPYTEDELRIAIQTEVHEDYMFQNYLLKLLDSYKNHPEGYQLLIPSQLLILEGTLSETFRIDEKGMAGDIKKRMHLLWDLLYAVYLKQPFNISFSFHNQISLTNIKEMFGELTKSSKSAVRINRNAVLHGRSHPNEWLHEDFHLLTQLLHSSLYMRRTIDIMIEDLTEYSTDGLLNAIPLKEYRETLIDDVLSKVNNQRKSGHTVSINDIEQRIGATLSKELKKIMTDEKTVGNLIKLINIQEIAKDPKFQKK